MKRFLFTCLALMLSFSVCYAAGTVTLSTHRDCSKDNCLDTYRWDFVIDGSTAVDTTKWVDIYGKIVGVKFIEAALTDSCTITLLDGAGRDILQGLFSDTEASATVTADNHYRVPVDDTNGGLIIQKGPAYISVSSGTDTETGALEVYVIPYNSTLPPSR